MSGGVPLRRGRKNAVGRLVTQHGQPKLLEIVLALHVAAALRVCLHRRQQQGNQDADDRDDDQKLDKGKTCLSAVHGNCPSRLHTAALTPVYSRDRPPRRVHRSPPAYSPGLNRCLPWASTFREYTGVQSQPHKKLTNKTTTAAAHLRQFNETPRPCGQPHPEDCGVLHTECSPYSLLIEKNPFVIAVAPNRPAGPQPPSRRALLSHT